MSQNNAYRIKKSILIDGTLLLIYLIATVYIFYFLSTARPHVGMWQELLIIIPLFGVIRRAFFTLYTLLYKKQVGHKLIISVASFVASIIISSLIANISSSLSADMLTRSYQPLLNALHSDQISQCSQPDDELDIPDSFRPLVKNRGTAGIDYFGTVYFSNNHFVVAVTGDSFTENSSTLYYQSQGKTWHQFHNEIYNDRSIFEQFTKNSMVCKIRELKS